MVRELEESISATLCHTDSQTATFYVTALYWFTVVLITLISYNFQKRIQIANDVKTGKGNVTIFSITMFYELFGEYSQKLHC